MLPLPFIEDYCCNISSPNMKKRGESPARELGLQNKILLQCRGETTDVRTAPIPPYANEVGM